MRASPSRVSHLSNTLQPVGVPLDRAGTSTEWGTPPVSFSAPPDDRMSITALEGELSLSEYGCIAPFGVVALSEPDPEMTAMLSRAGENVGLLWSPPPHPDSSRLDEWFLGGGRAESAPPPPPPPLRCHSPGSAWGAYKIVEGTFYCRNKSWSSSPPHHPRWWSCFGVHGHPLCGAVCGHATVSNSCYHSAGWSVSPLTGLFVLVRSNWQCLKSLWGGGFCPEHTHTSVNTHTPWAHTRSSGQPSSVRHCVDSGSGEDKNISD